jgi:pyruvate, orthophosphate dikinase
MPKWVYGFGAGQAEGNAQMRELLGGKGANLHEMSRLGLPVPPGFTITTEVCTHFFAHNESYPPELEAEVASALAGLEGAVGARFGDAARPLLVSVRSGARASMPGMMDTVLNLGLNDRTAAGLARETGDPRFAYDSYRRFIQMYSSVVLGLEHHYFEDILDEKKHARQATLDTELGPEDWRDIVRDYLACVEREQGAPFPQDPRAQLWGALGAVFSSWMNQRAITYRRLHEIPESWGTAVNVQAMVFGNMGEDCATGVAFTRNPSTGAPEFYGEYLPNAQGEDVVAGIRTPRSLTNAGRMAAGGREPSLEESMPGIFAELDRVRGTLETHFRDMQDIEFTVQKGKLWMLQTRTGKRTAEAALRIAVDLATEGLIDRPTAVCRVDPAALDQLLHPTLDPKATRVVLARGLPASPGAASGTVVFSADEAEARGARGEAVLLCRTETSPDDVHGMHSARGIVTTRGGMTSHAAVVARGMGRPCVVGAGEIRLDYEAGTMTAGPKVVRKGDTITIDGSTGEVMLGAVATVQPNLSGNFGTLMDWADQVRRLKIRANAETPADARQARLFGAEGIGLCRTEHMFFMEDRIVAMREMILAADLEGRRRALAKILPMQRADFLELFRIMEGLPVTVRLLDPPLHEFLPHSIEEMSDVATAAGVSLARVKARAAELYESNPMLGHRGCRLGISYPEIYEMQTRAIFEAAAAATAEGVKLAPVEVMIPLAATKRELDILIAVVDQIAARVEKETGRKVPYLVGTMIELPRAALQAGLLAQSTAFFSFGTNDLTQTTFGLSRDDSASFLETYRRHGIFERDPFQSIDVEGVGELVRIAVERGRKTRPHIKLGICGEHGGDPASIRFCEEVGLDYVSCSPFRVPIARLAAAQAALAAKGGRIEQSSTA